MAQGELVLVSGGEDPRFVTGLVKVSKGDAGNRLVATSNSSDLTFSGFAFGLPTSCVAVYLILNASDEVVSLQRPGIGFTLPQSDHSALVVEHGEPFVVDIRVQFENDFISHEFSPPISAIGDVNGFISFITTEPDGIQVETREAKFRRLE